MAPLEMQCSESRRLWVHLNSLGERRRGPGLEDLQEDSKNRLETMLALILRGYLKLPLPVRQSVLVGVGVDGLGQYDLRRVG